jgi:hypothetical protein
MVERITYLYLSIAVQIISNLTDNILKNMLKFYDKII